MTATLSGKVIAITGGARGRRPQLITHRMEDPREPIS
jgi:hypothetical protein